ncbi:S9 family peptidase [Caulobacter sp. 17J80-11]|uniref:alpha/beta hydrolase family protein n=1 Tax=Caulobacter sp. 17J80-11 TaxID=2763502 RepID=UPI0016534A8A|nr:S9 family peptidase [Caulobacter sp. 17J80-11]MBC6981612.1 S9 family peptidase [Caulobacter sp. 17J80-11]
MTKSFRKSALALLAGAAVSALALSAGAASAADGRGFTAKDMVMLERISDPQVSPDGRFAVYSLRQTDWEKNKGVNSLWIVDLKAKGAQPARMGASDGGALSPRWSADGKSIYFLSARSGSMQVWKTDATGANAVQVTNLPIDVQAFRTSPDGKTMVVGLAVFPDCDTLKCTTDRTAEKAASKATGVLYDKLFVRHWDTWADGTQNHLYSLSLDAAGVATGEPVALMKGFDGDAPTKPFGDDADYGFSPDSKEVWFSARVAGKTEPWSTNFDLWSVPVDGSAAPKDLTAHNPAWDAGMVMSPDGKLAAYRAMKRPGFEADRFHIMLWDETTKTEREVAAGWDRSADDLKWSADGKTLYVLAGDVGQTRVFAIDVKTDKVTPVTGPGHVSGFQVSGQNLVYVQDDLTKPAQLFTMPLKKGGKATQLTNVNADKLAGVAMGQPEQFSFAGWNGETVYGYVVKPANYKEGEKYPVAFLIHGGPQGSFGNLFHYRWNAQTYAGAGYAVVMIDFHGSTGYGQAFTDSISKHWGDRPLEDLQKGWSAALSKYSFLDGDRACALGGSYGGFMVNWIAGNWSGPWKCLVNHDGVFDQRMMGYASEELWFTEWENGGMPWQNPEGYERFNPVNHVAAWNKPMLVVQGGQDFRIPLEQGLGTFTALQSKEIPSEFLYFENENHWVLKPQNSVQWHDTVLGWLDRWTKQ